MADINHFITRSRFDHFADYVAEKTTLLEAHNLNRDGRMRLASDVCHAVTAWRPTDSLEELLHIVALAAVVDTSKSAEAINQSIQEILPVFRDSADPEDLQAAESIVLIAVDSFSRARFNPVFTDINDLLESGVPIRAPVLAKIIALLIDDRKRAGQTVSLETAIGIVYSDKHFSAGDREYRDILTSNLFRELAADFWAVQLPKLKLQAREEGSCTICRFLRTAFDRIDPFLLMIVLRPGTDWVLDPHVLAKLSDIGRDELEDIVRTKGYEMVPSELLRADYAGDEFFDRVANARRRTRNFLDAHTNNVVPFRAAAENNRDKNAPGESGA